MGRRATGVIGKPTLLLEAAAATTEMMGSGGIRGYRTTCLGYITTTRHHVMGMMGWNGMHRRAVRSHACSCPISQTHSCLHLLLLKLVVRLVMVVTMMVRGQMVHRTGDVHAASSHPQSGVVQ